MWANDGPNGKAHERFATQGPDSVITEIRRFDEHRIYFIHDKNCNHRNVSGMMPPVWEWLADARYAGIIIIEGRNAHLWKGHLFGDLIEVAVNDRNANEPLFILRNGTQGEVAITFGAYAEHRPHESWFRVPDVCRQKI